MAEGLIIKSPASGGAHSQPGPKWEGRLLTPDQLVVGRYRIIHELGKGGQSSVYLATDEITSRKIALKYGREVNIDRMAEFAEEECMLRKVAHIPGVSKILDSRIDLHEIFMALEYAGNGTLKGLYKTKDFSWVKIRGILSNIAQILEGVHQTGTVHRDVKPSNVTLDEQNTPTLIDFGLAFGIGAQTPSRGKIVGTPAYMAPEQAKSSDSLDQRIDTYALSVILYQAIHGTIPFIGKTALETIILILNNNPDINLPITCPDAPSSLRAVVEKGLQKDPKDRFQTAKEFAQALELA